MVGTDGSHGGYLGLVASGFYFAGINFLLMGDNSQTSLKTATLLAIAALMGLPLNASIGYICIYCIFAVMWLFLLYQIWFNRKKSWVYKTYNPEIDKFPHWLFCLAPAVAIPLVLFFLLPAQSSGFGSCRQNYASNILDCTDLLLSFFSFLLEAFAFMPQVYLIFQVWYAQQRFLLFKIKLFMGCMFVCYSLWTALWIWQNSIAFGSWGDFVGDIFFLFLCANLSTLVIIASPWIYRGSCVRCCGIACCVSSKSIESRKGSGEPGNVELKPNTGANNHDQEELPTTQEAAGAESSKSWFAGPWGGSGSQNDSPSSNNAKRGPYDDDDRVDPEAARAISISGPSAYMYPASSITASTTSTPVSAFSNNAPSTHSQWADTNNNDTNDGTPDWLK